jgi:transglutaminase-like putative cysteine protease
MRIAIEHITRYQYAEQASYSIQMLRLTPSDFEGHKVLDWQVSGRPAGVMTPSRDGFGNAVHLMAVSEPHAEIEITAKGTVEVEDRQGIVRGLDESVPLRVFLRRTPLTEPGEEIAALMAAVPAGEPIPRLHALTGMIRDRVAYLTGVTDSATTAAEALKVGKGVCQDHAHIFIAAARTAGIPARYVTGYLLMDWTNPEPAHHAWAEAWIDGLGWLGFDVANRICPTERYVRLASGLDAHDTAPIRGSRRGGHTETLDVHVLVEQQGGQQ